MDAPAARWTTTSSAYGQKSAGRLGQVATPAQPPSPDLAQGDFPSLRQVATAPPGWLLGCCLCDDRKREQIAVDPTNQLFGVVCHCRKCQRWHGAGHAPVIGFLHDHVVLIGERSLGYAKEKKQIRKMFCRDCGCPIVTVAEGVAGTYPGLFNADTDPDDDSLPLARCGSAPKSDGDGGDGPAGEQVKWKWDQHEYLKFRNKALPDDGLPPPTLKRYLDCPVEFGGGGDEI